MGILKLLEAVSKGLLKQSDAAKKIAEMGYPESVAKRIASGELPMDEASRAARRDAFGVRTVHGTGDPQGLTEVDTNLVDIGLHSGTPQQANSRLNDVYKARNFVSFAPRNTFEDGAGILPLVVKEGKQLNMEDVGDWMNSMQVIEGMISNPAFKKYKNQLEDMYDEAGNIASQFDGGDELFRDSPENREFLDELRAMITDEGYDSIKYKNQVENIYGSDAGYSPEGEAARKELFDELNFIEKNAHMSRPNPPNPNDPNLSDKLDAYLNWKPNYTQGERIRQDEIRKLLAEIEADPKLKNDPNSIISLNPSNVRSEFAAFDPEYTGSNILGSAAPIAAGTLGAGTLGSMLFGSNNAEASPISFFAKGMKKIDDEIAKYEEIAEQYRGYLPNAETASAGEILREVNPQYSKYYQELKQMKSTAPLRSETENIRAVNDIIKNKRKDLPSVAIGTGALGGMSPEEKLFASNQPEMSALPEGGIRDALYSVGDVLKSRERDDITSTQELGDVFHKLGRGEKLGLMDYLESTAVTDPTSYPAILDALKEYLRKNGNN